MIRRIDRLQTELPPPSDPDPAGAAAVQELLGGKFGEMSTFMNYTFQSFNFRNRQGARPFYDLVCEHRGRGVRPCRARRGDDQHDADRRDAGKDGRAPKPRSRALKGIGNPHHFLAGGQGALPQNSQGRPWNGDYVFSSGDLVEDLTHNFFLETGARNGKLKVYEMVEHPAARALTGLPARPRRRASGRLCACARAPDRRRHDEAVPVAADPDRQDPGVQAAHQARRPPPALPLLAGRLPRARAVFNGPHPETGEELVVVDEPHPRACPRTTCPPQPAVFAPDYAPEEIAADRREAPREGRPVQEAIRRGRKRLATLEASDSHAARRRPKSEHQMSQPKKPSTDNAPPESDPHTAESAQIHKRFEESMSEKGLLEEDGSLALEPEAIEHEEPPGTEQTPG